MPAAPEREELPERLSDAVTELFSRTRQRTYLAQWEGDETVVVDARGHQGLARIPDLRERIPVAQAHALAVTKALVATSGELEDLVCGQPDRTSFTATTITATPTRARARPGAARRGGDRPGGVRGGLLLHRRADHGARRAGRGEHRDLHAGPAVRGGGAGADHRGPGGGRHGHTQLAGRRTGGT